MKKLSSGAYGGVTGKEYKPYAANSFGTKFGGPLVLIFGIILAAIFGASTAYSGMKAGITVAAGIPGAIIGSGLVSLFVKKKSVLSTNLISGMASGGETIASGAIYVMPAVILVGGKINLLQGFIIGAGAVIFTTGIMSIVENYLVVSEHGQLLYPESMAISEAMVAADAGGEALKNLGVGFGIGGILTTISSSVFGLVNNTISQVSEKGYRWKFEMEANPMLVGLGFIVGIKVALVMFAGAVITNFALIPLVGYFTELANSGLTSWDSSSLLINEMTVNQIASSYTKYIGAGMMISGGIIGAVQLVPTIVTSISQTLKSRKATGEKEGNTGMKLLVIGLFLTVSAVFVVTTNSVMFSICSIVMIALVVMFTIVAARLTGTIGHSNLPISGMAIACIVIMTLIFVIKGWTSNIDNQVVLLLGTFAIVAISYAGSFVQSQKVTFVMGGNRSEMMIYYMIAGLVGTGVVFSVFKLLENQLAVTGDNAPFAIPQANLMATLTQGIMQGKLPWVMVIIGIVLGIVFTMIKVPTMTLALGVYLPFSTTSIIFVGALIRELVELLSKKDDEKKSTRVSNGISLSSGLIAGGSIIGLIGIILQVTGIITPRTPNGLFAGNSGALLMLVALVVLTLLAILRKSGERTDTHDKKAI